MKKELVRDLIAIMLGLTTLVLWWIHWAKDIIDVLIPISTNVIQLIWAIWVIRIRRKGKRYGI